MHRRVLHPGPVGHGMPVSPGPSTLNVLLQIAVYVLAGGLAFWMKGFLRKILQSYLDYRDRDAAARARAQSEDRSTRLTEELRRVPRPGREEP